MQALRGRGKSQDCSRACGIKLKFCGKRVGFTDSDLPGSITDQEGRMSPCRNQTLFPRHLFLQVGELGAQAASVIVMTLLDEGMGDGRAIMSNPSILLIGFADS